jgi:serine/threonine-protein kinase
VTREGVVLGTPEFLSPEICKGGEPSAAADLWAAAVVLYYALTGSAPIEDANAARVFFRIVTEPIPSIGERRPDLPLSLVWAVDKALSPAPEARFGSARAFAEALVPDLLPSPGF